MSRCIACNCKIDRPPMKLLPNGEFDDMCKSCLGRAFDSSYEKEYEHSNVTEDTVATITGLPLDNYSDY